MLIIGSQVDCSLAFSEIWAEVGGADRDRTDDLVIANDALSQLSYGPTVPTPEDRTGG